MGRSTHSRGSAPEDEAVQNLDLVDTVLVAVAFLTMVIVVIVAAAH